MAGPRYKQFKQPDAGSSFVQVGDTALGGVPGDISGGAGGNDFHYDATLDLLNLTGDVTIGGDLTVQGTTITIGSQIQVADRYLLMNSEYTAAAALDAGLVINVDPSATSFSISGIATNVITIVAGDASAALGVGDFVLVQNAATASNAGLYEVLSVTTSTITIDVTPVHGWANTSITDDATTQGTVVGVKLSVIRASSTGALETSTGTTAPLTFGASFDGSTGVGTLSGALNVGTGITPSVANGDLTAGDSTGQMFWDSSAKTLDITSITGSVVLVESQTGLLLRGTTVTHADIRTFAGNSAIDLTRINGTPASPANVVADDLIGVVAGRSYTDNVLLTHASILFYSDGSTSSITRPGRIEFATAAATGSVTQRWVIGKDGGLFPFVDGTYDIGTTSLRPATLYSGNMNASGFVNVGATTIAAFAGDFAAGSTTRRSVFIESVAQQRVQNTNVTERAFFYALADGGGVALSSYGSSYTPTVAGVDLADSSTLWGEAALSNGMGVGVSAGDLRIFTAATPRWKFSDASGHFLTEVDNTIDIGASGATRPRSVYIGTSLVAPALTSDAALSITTTTTSALTVDTGTTGAINIGTNANAKTITLGNGTGATALVYNSGTGGHLFTGNMGFFGVGAVAQQTNIVSLTDSSGGTANDVVAAITNANNVGSADVLPTADAIADLAAKVNGILTILSNLGLMA